MEGGVDPARLILSSFIFGIRKLITQKCNRWQWLRTIREPSNGNKILKWFKFLLVTQPSTNLSPYFDRNPVGHQ